MGGSTMGWELDHLLESRLSDALLASSRSLFGAPERLTVLFSGGLDSSFLASFLSARWPVRLATMGVTGSPDLLAAREGAALLGLPWTPCEVGTNDVQELLHQFPAELEELREPGRSVAIAFGLAIAKSPTGRLVCGQGADELFFGYAHYRGRSPTDRRARRQEDLHRLLRDDWPLAQRLAAAYGRDVAAPFLDPRFIDLVLELPENFLTEGTETKPLLRSWARARKLPEQLAGRPKRALQYGAGISRLVRIVDRRDRADGALIRDDPSPGVVAQSSSERRDVRDQDAGAPVR